MKKRNMAVTRLLTAAVATAVVGSSAGIALSPVMQAAAEETGEEGGGDTSGSGGGNTNM